MVPTTSVSNAYHRLLRSRQQRQVHSGQRHRRPGGVARVTGARYDDGSHAKTHRTARPGPLRTHRHGRPRRRHVPRHRPGAPHPRHPRRNRRGGRGSSFPFGGGSVPNAAESCSIGFKKGRKCTQCSIFWSIKYTRHSDRDLLPRGIRGGTAAADCGGRAERGGAPSDGQSGESGGLRAAGHAPGQRGPERPHHPAAGAGAPGAAGPRLQRPLLHAGIPIRRAGAGPPRPCHHRLAGLCPGACRPPGGGPPDLFLRPPGRCQGRSPDLRRRR